MCLTQREWMQLCGCLVFRGKMSMGIKWISVEDRLPEEEVRVLICVDGCMVTTSCYARGGWIEG